MRRLLMPLLLLSVAAPALAANHVRWNAPFGDAAASVDRAFACDVNTGEERLVFSFWPPDSIERVVGFLLVADIQLQGFVTDWWQGGCRVNGFSHTLTPDPTWDVRAPQGPAFGGIDLSEIAPGRARLRALGAWEDEGFGVGPASGEVFLMTVVIRHTRTVPEGATPVCAGCAAPACIGFNLLQLESLAPDNSAVIRRYEGYTSLDQQFYVTWQGGLTTYPCPAAVPTRSTTWGRIKASYR